ncbi:RDD family protein [Halolamina salifodinae]|uniref:Putative RDD family membrane protein YckC n=1 Tax=Halolamina salifodinae TaxID=1202767 RepID=A0A8T4GS88_9EURY|nr:RDD family protein [Halolamina salifodinae]MBP1985706.1 putative RDD family membrane protein YckC [Halolamina salifodinae]
MPRSSTYPGNVNVLGARLVAQLIDLVAMFLLMLVAIVALVVVFPGVDAAGAELLGVLTFVGVALGYGTVLEGTYGKTLGKMATNVRVVCRDGSEIDYGQAFGRNIPALFGGWPTWFVGMVAIAANDDNQRLFDELADTYVVRDTGQ